jgi:hypothetical protein
MMLGKHLIKSWCTTQQVIATSSGEAELYALVKGAYQTKGLISMLVDMGHTLDGKVCTDASAAIGIVHRRGLGKVKHLDVQHLWVQQEVHEGRIGIEKVGTLVNPADLFTKALCTDTIARHLKALGFTVDAGRASTAPTLVQNVYFPAKGGKGKGKYSPPGEEDNPPPGGKDALCKTLPRVENLDACARVASERPICGYSSAEGGC